MELLEVVRGDKYLYSKIRNDPKTNALVEGLKPCPSANAKGQGEDMMNFPFFILPICQRTIPF
jgi:hypothetical protein